MQENHRFCAGVVSRIAAALADARPVADAMYQWGLDIVENIKKGRQRFIHHTKYLTRQKVSGLWEAPTGELGHWIDVEGKKIKTISVCCAYNMERLPER